MVFWFFVLAATLAYADPPSAEQTRAVLARLGKEADRFEANAHRFVGLEILRQTQPAGTRFGRGPRGIVTKLPEATNEIVSEYGYVSVDEPGGSLKEVRSVLTVNGLKWKRGKKQLADLADGIAARDGKNRVKALENYEALGLRGFLSDAGQVILLFARRGTERYEFAYDRQEVSATHGPLWIYRYQQLDGGEAFTIYGGSQPLRHKLGGEVAVTAGDGLPVRVSIHSEYLADGQRVRDITKVDYQMTQWALLLPERIDHRQFVDGALFVVDEFLYEKYKEILPGRQRE